MSLVESLLDFLKKKNTPDELPAPKGICPNCWGREEYGGHFYERVKQENLNVNSKKSDVGWVSDYANKHLPGIALTRTGNGEELVCGKCKVSYQESDGHTDKPSQLHGHAYAQGADIHLEPGQEKHLPHEAWNVVQQKQGRVKPTK